MVPNELPVVSITFRGDVRLTFLQILSFDRLFELNRLGTFYVVINDPSPEQALETRRILRGLLSANGIISDCMRDRLRIIDWNDVFPSVPKVGQRDQQAIKLGISRLITEEFFLVLDGKNHFVRPSNIFDFFESGNPKLPLTKKVEEFWKPCLYPSVDVMEADERFKSSMWPSVTPYVMYTKYAREVCQFLENKYCLPLPLVFNETGDATEFLMYYAYVADRYGTDGYADVPQPNKTLFTIAPRYPEQVEALIESVRDENISMFGLHRNRIPKLTGEQKSLIANLWYTSLLYPWESANWFMVR